MDFIEGLPKSGGSDVILVIVDRFTKVAHFFAISNHYAANGVAQVFFDNIYKLHRVGTQLHLSTSYHPQTDGQTERVNRCLETYLRCLCFQQPRKWKRCLTAAEWWYNTNHHTALKMSPFQALYRAQNLMKQYADRNRSERSFEVGDLVYLKLQPYRQTSIALRRNLKLSSKYYGPYKPSAKGAVVHSQPPTLTEEGEVQIAPAAVLARRTLQRHGRDVEQALIQWKNLDTADATWEDGSAMQAQFLEFGVQS
ncbi:uncharacterized protein [Coffea arabica]|uniref:Integrase catalytic domain-containing protein n=1 Tax=Coffea arabica TaxID=13443 RepID=A0ABM4VCD3_COFAR